MNAARLGAKNSSDEKEMSNSASRKRFNLRAYTQLLSDSKILSQQNINAVKLKKSREWELTVLQGVEVGGKKYAGYSCEHKKTGINSLGCEGAVFSGCPIMSRSMCNPFI